MLDLLDPAERRALLAHERAHLSRQHHLFVAAVEVASAANPLLRPLIPVVRYTIERWADEISAGRVGDRSVVARAIGKAALATRHAPPAPRMALAATAGPVPRRVTALLTAPPAHRLTAVLRSPIGLCAVAALLLSAMSGLAGVDALNDLQHLLALTKT
jgi:beta-lactamase regulating signal transducer with metallopeptidase domain